jgi:hypothetical protein
VAEIVSPHLVGVGARWEDGPAVGAWIAERLGSFGPSVGHAVPLGYPAYAIVPITWGEDADGRELEAAGAARADPTLRPVRA